MALLNSTLVTYEHIVCVVVEVSEPGPNNEIFMQFRYNGNDVSNMQLGKKITTSYHRVITAMKYRIS